MMRLQPILRTLALVVILSSVVRTSCAAEPDRANVAPGLVGRYYSEALGGDPACVRVDPAIGFDWSDGMPDEALTQGSFSVVWEGQVQVRQPGKYRFGMRGTGRAEIRVRDCTVYSGSHGKERQPNRRGEGGDPLPLGVGDYPIRVTYPAPAAKARVQLIWSSDAFPAEVLNARYLAHDTAAEQPVMARLAGQRGREVVERYGCARCHPIAGVDRSRRPGLPMPHVAQMNPRWVARWLRNPQAVRPGTRMGAPGGTPEQIEQVIANLLALVQTEEISALIEPRWRRGHEPDPLDRRDLTALVREGRQRFYELGCSACHAPETPGIIDVTRGPSLADLGSKWSKAYLRQLMLDPVGRHPTGGMPGYTLEPIDVDRLVAYMASFTLSSASGGTPQGDAPPPTVKLELLPGQSVHDPNVVADVKEPILKRMCFGCHSPQGKLAEGPALDPAKARWDAGCLRADRKASYAPQYTLGAADRAAVIAFLRQRPKNPSTPASHERADRLIRQTLYCFACHRRDGSGGEPLTNTVAHYLKSNPLAKPEPIAPPDLTGVGARLAEAWMLNSLAGKAPSNRRFLTVLMPNFGLDEAQQRRIAARLADADRIPDLQVPPVIQVPQELRPAHTTLMGSRGFNCLNCHFLGAAGYQSGKSGPDLTMAPQRLSRAWFHRWVSNTARMLPGTAMPAFTAPVPGIASEDLPLQKEIIWQFLQGACQENRAAPPL